MLNNEFAVVFTPDEGRLPQSAQLKRLAGSASRVLVFVASAADAQTLRDLDASRVEIVAVEDGGGWIGALNRALYPLVRSHTDILFVAPQYEFDEAAVVALRDAMRADPLYGFALPRTNTGGSASVPRMPGDEPVSSARDFDAFLEHLPEYAGGGIVHAAPVLVRASVLDTFGRLEGESFDLSDALARLFIRANRRGHSAVVSHRALFFAPESRAYEGPAAAPVIARASDLYRAIERRAALPDQVIEKLLWYRLKPKALRYVLFDIRNLAPGFNGTAQHILSLIPPLLELAGMFGIAPSFWVAQKSAEFHGLDQAMRERLIYELPDGSIFDACIRLSQPWSFSELRDQARLALVNMYLIMDAIAWDCHYIRMPHIDGVWRTAAATADGFVYNSGYTQRAFAQRFPQAASVPSAVSWCSLDPAEYFVAESGEQSQPAQAPYVLIVGNHYYHKGLYEVVHVLAASFPETRFKVLGEIGEQYPNVEQHPSGMLSHEDVDRLFRDCACLVFPSHYEGFGLPILKALAFGKQIIARSSTLLDEIGARVSPVEGIVPFETRSELLNAVAQVLGDAARLTARRTQPLAPAQPYGWRAAAQDILTLASRLIDDVATERCLDRLEFFYRSEQFDVERVGWTNADQNKIIFEVELEE
ncbi:hypothetical protein LMG28688_00219 [Paraburkholderia caffeinitolerans]|uniref:Glycosyl transferase family 1 domain-containing protein n=1 Tax=Paraburkholderia caffeinitolerans TaxID=1723730 RepID=A0A6J5FDW2_9BURK|nr:glycosyltransferase [Paraburkholderia caffeinitolerans]CAB3776373.1 hypothetical protein LMG28688_00219 [Paraburkholderia caffeinitolerans]